MLQHSICSQLLCKEVAMQFRYWDAWFNWRSTLNVVISKLTPKRVQPQAFLSINSHLLQLGWILLPSPTWCNVQQNNASPMETLWANLLVKARREAIRRMDLHRALELDNYCGLSHYDEQVQAQQGNKLVERRSSFDRSLGFQVDLHHNYY